MNTVYLESGRVHSAVGSFGGAASGASNASPIVVTFSAAHNLVDGDQIQGSGFSTNTAANTLAYAKVTGYSTTTIGLYSDAALTVPIAGNGTTGAGAVSMATDISGMTGDVTLTIKAENEVALKGCIVHIQDSVDGFVSDKNTIALIDLSGAYPIGGVTKSVRKYEMPQGRFGVSSARLRVYVAELDGSNSITLTVSLQ